MFILHAASNSVSTLTSWTNFMLSVDGNELSDGVHSAMQHQFILITIVGVKNLEAGSHSITAQWSNQPGIISHMGAQYPTRLIGLWATGAPPRRDRRWSERLNEEEQRPAAVLPRRAVGVGAWTA